MGVLHGSIPWLAIAVRQNKNSREGVGRKIMIFKIILISFFTSVITSLFVTKGLVGVLSDSWLKISEQNYKNSEDIIKSVIKDRLR